MEFPIGGESPSNRWLVAGRAFSPISDEIYEFLRRPIQFKDRTGQPLFVYVQNIEAPTPSSGEFVRFSFRIRRKADPRYAGPQIRVSGHVAQRRRALHGNVFGYVFTSLNSLEENRRNLEDFVLRQVRSK